MGKPNDTEWVWVKHPIISKFDQLPNLVNFSPIVNKQTVGIFWNMTGDDEARSINCVLSKYPQNTEDQFDNIIKKASKVEKI